MASTPKNSKRQTKILDDRARREAERKQRLATNETVNYFKPGVDAASKLGFTDPLGRIDTGALQGMATPGSATYLGQRPKDLQDVISLMNGGLSGLNAVENQGLREQGMKEMDRQYLGQLAELRNMQAKSGVRGASATAQMGGIAKQNDMAKEDLEQNLMLKNIDIQDKRRNDLAGLLGTLGNQEAARGLAAQGQYLDASKYNVEQGNKERNLKIQAGTGLTGTMEANKNSAAMIDLAKKGQVAPYDPNALANKYEEIINKFYGIDPSLVQQQ